MEFGAAGVEATLTPCPAFLRLLTFVELASDAQVGAPFGKLSAGFASARSM